MSRHDVLSGLAGFALAASAVLGFAGAAQAAPTDQQKVAFECEMPSFGPSADFTYAATVDFTSAGAEDLQASLSEMPGVVPAFITMTGADAAEAVVELGVKVDGASLLLAGLGKTDINPGSVKSPVKIPAPLTGKVSGLAVTSTVVVETFAFDIAGVQGLCSINGVAKPSVPVKPSSSPQPTNTATPTATATPTPTSTPKPTETSDPSGTKGSPASGQVTLKCQMKGSFTKAYDSKVKVTVAGARATADDAKVTLAADFGDIPGLAPVPITDGTMRVFSTLLIGDKESTVKGSSVVNAAANEPVPVPRMTGEVKLDGERHKVTVKSFRFEFDPIAGAEVAADCTESASIGTMTVGIGSIDEAGGSGSGAGGSGSSGGSGGNGSGTSTTLPRTGGGDAMPVIGLWALGLGVAGAALLVWLPRQRRTAN